MRLGLWLTAMTLIECGKVVGSCHDRMDADVVDMIAQDMSRFLE